MILTWMPVRRIRKEDSVYAQLRHWLVNGDGRILACITEPPNDNPEDSFDARIYLQEGDDDGYFISLEHAMEWCEKRVREKAAAEEKKKLAASSAVTVEASI
jgi:hypothetical protein